MREKSILGRGYKCGVLGNRNKDQFDGQRGLDYVRSCKFRKGVCILFEGSFFFRIRKGNKLFFTKVVGEVGIIFEGVRGQNGKRDRGRKKDVQQDSSQNFLYWYF